MFAPVAMSDESRDGLEKELEEAAWQGSGKDPGLGSANGADGNHLELEDFRQDESKRSDHGQDLDLGLCRAPVSIEVRVVQAPRAPQEPQEPQAPQEPLEPQAPEPVEGERAVGVNRELVKGSSDSLQTDGGALQCDSDYSSMKSSPSYTCTSFSPDFCEERLSELDRSALEKTTNVSPLNFSASYSKTSKNTNLNAGSDLCEADFSKAGAKTDNSVRRGTSARGRRALRKRDSLDTGPDEDGKESDGRSNHSRRTVKEGMCCCYQTVRRGCLQCVEETPAMLPGLVLSLAFCVTIIVLIPTTGRVRHPIERLDLRPLFREADVFLIYMFVCA